MPAPQAQTVFPDSRPLQLPDFAPRQEAPRPLLPPVERRGQSDLDNLAAGLRLFVRDYRLLDNSVLDPQTLNELTAPYRDRAVSFAELQALRESLTQAYIDRGYITSGVLLPEQQVDDGVVVFRAIEGRLGPINVDSPGRFQARYFSERLRASAAPVIKVDRIEQRLQLFQQDDRIEAIRAELTPTGQPGEAALRVQVRERQALRFHAGVDNHTAPAIGAEGLRMGAEHANLRGIGDRLSADLRLTEGLQELVLDYSWPIHPDDTSLALHLRSSQSEVIDENFDDLEIESETMSYGLSLIHPLQRTPHRRLDVFAGLERRRSESFLLGSGFSFTDGPEDGLARISVIRTGLDWAGRSSHQVAALRAQLSLGVDAFGVTRHDDDRPDALFNSLLGQLQWVRRYDWLDARLIARADLQLSDDRLLGMEQFSLGGHASVRGYREHQVVRDQGLFASLEGRIPVWRAEAAASHADLALFIDAGEARNHGAVDDAETLQSLGLGLVGRWQGRWHYSLYWADPQTKPDRAGEYDLQDDGLHFRVSYQWPGDPAP